MTGTIKRLVEDHGFGFIASDDGKEYFFQRSAVEDQAFDDLREGEPVEFDPEPVAPKGPRARLVKRAAPAATSAASAAPGAAA
jgi:cold shock CspA family protein